MKKYLKTINNLILKLLFSYIIKEVIINIIKVSINLY